MKSRLCLFFITVSVLLYFKTNAQTVIAQSTGTIGSYDWENRYDPDEEMVENRIYGQTFKSLVSASISEIDFYIYTVFSAGTYDMEIYSCSSQTSWGALLNTKTNISLSTTGWIAVDVSALNVSVTSGDFYGFRLIPHFGLYGALSADVDTYADGHSWTSYDNFDEATDITFKAFGNTTLPVQLTSFTAQKQNDHVLLQWSTASEQNAKDFTIQRSKDGSSWNNIGTIAAHGNSNAIINYNYTDANPIAGMNYYRLLQTDIDGKSRLSETRAVKFINDQKTFSILANPVNDGQLKVQINKTTSLSLFDMAGKLLWKKQVVAGIQNIDVGKYQKGIYLLKAEETMEKILIQ